MPETLSLFASPYNFAIPLGEEVLLYSAFSGAVISLVGEDALGISERLVRGEGQITINDLPTQTVEQLFAGGFVVSDPQEQLKAISNRFQSARSEYPLVITLTTTMDCNLGCYYCYEERSTDKLEMYDVRSIVEYVSQRLKEKRHRSLHVDWYGGEPLLNVDFLESASEALQKYCRGLSISYSASLISNGTSWPDDVETFVKRHALRGVQISFDGLRENHNRRRRYRNADERATRSSFDEAVDLVSKLVKIVKVDIRFNIDSRNKADLLPFIEFARARRWFDGSFPAVFQPARLASYTEHSSFMRESELSLLEFDSLRGAAREMLARGQVQESETPEGFPYPKTSVCCALAHDSVVIGADGRQYRCGLQVSEPQHSTGTIRADGNDLFPIIGSQSTHSNQNQEWWNSFDPTTAPKCSTCSFLPVCWGGCPKKHFDGDLHAVREQGAFWRNNLARLVASGVSRPYSTPVIYSDRDQFRHTA